MRVKGVFTPADAGDGVPAGDVAAFFEGLFPGVAHPEIDRAHIGLAIVARNPLVALHLAKLSRCIALDTGWCRRSDLRELAIQAVNRHFRSEFSFQARRPAAEAAGLGDDLLAALPTWRTSSLFDAEQRLVLAYVESVVRGAVADPLFSRVLDRYGETGTIEFTTLIAIWSAWAMIINAAKPDWPEEP